MRRATEAVARRSGAQAGVMDLAELRAHIERAREQRARFITGLLRRGLGAVVRLLCRAVPASPRRRSCRRGRGPLAPPAGRRHPHPIEATRHPPVRTTPDHSRPDRERRALVGGCGSDSIEETAP